MRLLTRSLLTSTALAMSLAPTGVSAQATTWWDVLSPDRLAETFVQYGIIALRTQVDLQYEDLTVDALSGRVVITDVDLWPLMPWDTSGDCEINIDRLVLQSARLDAPELLRFGLKAYGASAPAACLPPDGRPVLAMAGLDRLEVPHVSMDMAYDLPSAGMEVAFHTTASGLAEVDLVADFSYVSVDGREDMEEPVPIVFLSGASLTVTNLGGWEVARPMIPAPFLDPDQGALALGGLLGAALGQMNREAAGADATGDPGALTPPQQALLDSALASWAGFVANPQRIVLETNLPPAETSFLDFELYEDNPVAAFQDLQPVVSLAPMAVRATLPVGQIQAALAEDTSGIPQEDLLAVGLALATGDGAPRAIDAAIRILTPLAEAGDGDAADALAVALEVRDPEKSYALSLLAGASGSSGATARLDRLERSLPFAKVLELQGGASQGVTHPVEALDSVSSIKAQARARLTGRGAPRSYEIAAMWAMIATAAGDAEGRSILDEIDIRVAAGGPGGMASWAQLEAAASGLALEAWIGRDLPTVYGAPPQ